MFDDFLLSVEVCVGVVDGWIIPFIQLHSKFTSNFRQNLSKSANFAVGQSWRRVSKDDTEEEEVYYAQLRLARRMPALTRMQVWM